MSHKLAVKRLTAADLTFFKWHDENNSSSKQKAINLNTDVFVEELYPALRNPSSLYRTSTSISIGVKVIIYGPGLAEDYDQYRKIVKTFGAKVWRLGGELVTNPESDPYRFNTLAVNDLAVFKFDQEPIPRSLKLLFISKTIQEDRNVYQVLDTLLGKNRTMMVFRPAELEQVIAAADPLPDHPIYTLTLDTDELNSDIEDIASGGSGRRIRTTSWSSGRKISRTDLQKAKESADYVGLQGEAYVNQYLQNLKAKGTIRKFEWTARDNAISPYDFWISDNRAKTLINVKSTQGEFERTLHVLLNELLRMREGPEEYAIYRVFNIKETTAQLRIVEDIGGWANQVLEGLESLPQGISSNSISFSPTVLLFGPTIDLDIEDWAEE